jgi:hypothetical protein
MWGLFRTEYSGRTLRENYGLARPQNSDLSLDSRYGLDPATKLGEWRRLARLLRMLP